MQIESQDSGQFRVPARLFSFDMVSSIKKFLEIQLQGAPAEVGYQHGKLLAPEIRDCLEFYRGIFALSENELLRQGQRFGKIIESFNVSYATEIRAVADGAAMDARLLFALNSRSEIFNNSSSKNKVAECTAVFNRRLGVLAQNWDWSEKLQSLVVDMRIDRGDGHRIHMLTEPGIIGKIGLNNAGLGVCLNILSSKDHLDGVPVHILLRAVLDSTNLDQARKILLDNCRGKASHILVADSEGDCFGIEFAGNRSHPIKSKGEYQLHTNHYLADTSLNGDEMFPSTYARLEHAAQLLEKDASFEGIRRMLCDQSRAELSICKPPTESDTPGFGRVGTLFTVLMDLKKQRMNIRYGSDGNSGFYTADI